MQRRNLLIFGLCLGLVLVGSPYSISYLFVSRTLPKISYLGEDKDKSVSEGFQGTLSSRCQQSEETRLVIGTRLEYPRRAYSKEAFEIRLTVFPKQIVINMVGCGKPDQTLAGITDRAALQNQFDRYQNLKWTLQIGGGEISPKDPQKVLNGKIKWIVTPPNEGILRAYASAVLSEGGPAVAVDRNGEHPAFSPPEILDSDEVEIKIDDRILTRTRIVDGALRFFGALLTLPGLIVFFRDVKNRQREARDKDKSRIILEP